MFPFSDTESQTGNTVQAAYLDLEVNGQNPFSQPGFTLTGLIPGGSTSNLYSLKNLGDINGLLSINLTNVVEDENVITEPETQAGDVTPTGELSSFLTVTITQDALQLYTGTWADFLANINGNPLASIGAGVTSALDLTFGLDVNAPNTVQTDKLSFDLEFKLISN